MKKLLVAAAMLVTVLSAKAADGTIDFTSQGNQIFDVNGTTALSGSSFLAQLAYGTVGANPSTFTAIGNPAPFLTGGGAGFWDPTGQGIVTATGAAGGSQVAVVVRAWTAASGSFTAATTAAGAKWGVSSPLTITLGNPSGTPPTTPADISGIASFHLTQNASVPEPSTIALGLLGAGALALRRRK